MTRRQVYFISDTGKVYVSDEFNGDRGELERFGSRDTCDKDWPEIQDLFGGVKSITDFLHAAYAAHGCYHSQFGDTPGPQIKVFSSSDDIPILDETYQIDRRTGQPVLDARFSLAEAS